ncbi:hypothetical protein QEK11_003949 [Klebsiella aerogenes]|nr:hypothetical protein [Klebsiella aerogenes]EKW1133643.1 hypothetical protein [Klebsiella aerogenes]
MQRFLYLFLAKLIDHPWRTMFSCLVLSILWVIIAYSNPFFYLSENQNLYIYSTQAQVLGAVYGLTLTAYVFLRNHQEREIEKDPTLDEIISTIQTKEYCFLIVITILSILAILFDLLTLTLYLDGSRWIIVATKNAATSLFVFSLLLISYFILKALKADKYESVGMEIIKDVELKNEESSKIDNVNESHVSIDNSSDKGYVLYGIFMELFINIENNLGLLYEKVYKKGYAESNLISNSDGFIPPNRRRLALSRLVKALIDARAIPEYLMPEIMSLIKYRNALVHTKDVDPSQQMVRNAKDINNEIEHLLKED